MARRYELTYFISSLSAARTLLYVTAPSTMVIRVVESSITNASNATNQQLRAVWQRVTTLGTPTATSITPTPIDPGDPAATFTAAANVTASEPTYTSGKEFGYRGFPSLVGYYWPVLDDLVLPVAPSASLGLRMLSTPTAFDAVVHAVVEEV